MNNNVFLGKKQVRAVKSVPPPNPNIQTVQKFNPDVNINYNKLQAQRDYDKNTFKPTNVPYKIITKDREQDFKKPIKTQKDLEIPIPKSLRNVDSELSKLSAERNYEDEKVKQIFSKDREEENKKRFEFRNQEIYKISYNESQYKDLKDDRIEFFKSQQKELENDKEKYNEIINNVFQQGLIK